MLVMALMARCNSEKRNVPSNNWCKINSPLLNVA